MIIAIYAIATVAVIVMWLPPVTRKLIAFEDRVWERMKNS